MKLKRINLKKHFWLSIALVMTLLVATGCSSRAGDTGQDNTETITITHSLEETHVKKNPDRVVVFDYGILDSLDKMGIEVLGLPKSSTVPTPLEKFKDDKYANVGGLKEPDFEKIYELNPDVIFISTRQADYYDEFSKIAPTIYVEVDGANYMESITKNLEMLGKVFDKEEFVQEELNKISQAIEELNKKVVEQGKNALIVMANDGLISAYGEGSRFGIIHKEFGFTPADTGIQVANHGQSITFEYILEKNPDYIFVIDRAASTGGSVTAEQIFDNEIIKQTDAYKNDRIVYLSSQIWYVASGGLNGTLTMIDDVASSL